MSASSYRFGRFRLDPRSRELWAGDELVAIPPKSLDCLAYLIEHRDRAVGRDELISAVWGSADVNDHSLAQTLLRARQVLGDTGAERTMIRTVPRFGHRWVAPTEVIAASAATMPPESASAAAATATSADGSVPRSHGGKRAWLVAGASLALVAALIGGYLWHARAPSMAVAAGDASELFVVLPVQLADDQPESAWVRLGGMDYIATLLRQNAKRHVLPSEQAVSAVGAGGRAETRDDGQLGRLRAVTGAGWIVSPRASASAQGWRFTLDVYHGDGLRSYEGSGATPLEASRSAAIALMDALGVPDAAAPQSPLPADELLQRIDAALLVGDLGQARHLIDDAPPALRGDPRLRVRAGQTAVRQGRPDEAESLFRPLASDDAAIPLQVRALAYLGLGTLTVGRLDFGAAEAAYDKVIALLKNSDEIRLLGRAYMGRGVVHASRNEFGAAMADFGQARVDLQRAGDRIGTANLEINVGMAEVNRGRIEQGIAALDRAIPILSGFGVRDQLVISLHNKAYAQLGLLDVGGALATSQRAMELAAQLPNQVFGRRVAAARARALFAAGRLRETDELIRRFDPQPDDPSQSDTEFSVLRAALLGERGDYAALAAQGDALLARVARSVDPTGQGLLSEASWMVIDAALRLGRIDRAEQVLQRLKSAPPAPEDLDRRWIEKLAEARLLAARKQPGAEAAFDATLGLAEERGTPSALVVAATAWLPVLLQSGELERAASLGGRLVPYADRDYHAARATAQLYRALGRDGLAGEAEARLRLLAGEREPRLDAQAAR
ncbi:winged helix-turn-helix domain-containing protein [Dokdonella sp.]|uniref:winged helix-turn-helix domain-containing protein n=1 Tax=Dokdonella sp. TaxID=2291710 RepID=UPI001B05C0FC|nr:winged helix-turn-helix domain-containing protein [Dokdonella sp.]MBO9661359.1 winged helix-turn-helix domain-containing protein [Dokdonella sp.]